jgi:membrane-associated phospholipid phosphatase
LGWAGAPLARGAEPPTLAGSLEARLSALDVDRATACAPGASCCTGCPPIAAEARPARGLGRTWPVVVGATLGLGVGALEGASAHGADAVPLERPTWGRDALPAALALGAGFLPKVIRHDPPACGKSVWSDCRPNGLDRAWRGAVFGEGGRTRSFEAREATAALSDAALAMSLMRPFGLALASDAPQRSRDVLLIGEAQVIQLGLVNGLKHVFHRPRPYAHFCSAADADEMNAHDSRLSFYSGHTSTAFAGAFAAWEIARRRGYRNRREILWTGVGLATATGALRTLADRHYLTDVLTGAAVGGVVGWLIPHLHRPDPTPKAASAGDRDAAKEARQVATTIAVPLRGGRRAGGFVHGGFSSGGPSLGVTWRW